MKDGRSLGAIIVAAGTSQRMAGRNKMFVPLGGKPLLAWSVDTCEMCSFIPQIVLVLNDKDMRRGHMLKERRNWSKVVICSGGAQRQDSVREGLKQTGNCELVMIHDGARPFLTLDLISKGFEVATETGAAVAAVPVKDTIKIVSDDGLIEETPPRDRLWAAQTPQIFRLDIITRAYESLRVDVTDDGTAVEQTGCQVSFYMGDHGNMKVTTPEDLLLARVLAKKNH